MAWRLVHSIMSSIVQRLIMFVPSSISRMLGVVHAGGCDMLPVRRDTYWAAQLCCTVGSAMG